MTSDRYLPRAPSLRPAPRKRLDRRLDKEPARGLMRDGAYPEGFNPLGSLEPADLPAPPARGPWEPKED